MSKLTEEMREYRRKALEEQVRRRSSALQKARESQWTPLAQRLEEDMIKRKLRNLTCEEVTQ
jgi:hypothetical protein